MQWLAAGASDRPCSDVYAGAHADSEPETRAIQGALRRRQGAWHAYVNVHAYSGMWLLPYGYDYTWQVRPANFEEMLVKARVGAEALRAVNGERFEVGASSDYLCEWV